MWYTLIVYLVGQLTCKTYILKMNESFIHSIKTQHSYKLFRNVYSYKVLKNVEVMSYM